MTLAELTINLGYMNGPLSRVRNLGLTSEVKQGLNKLLAFHTADPDRMPTIRWVDQRYYPLHLIAESKRGYVYVMSIEGMSTHGFVPPNTNPQLITDLIGPSYKYIKYWFEVPTRVGSANPDTPLEIFNKMRNEEGHAYQNIGAEEADELFSGYKWVVA